MIKIERPPNFEQILAVFPKAGDRGVLFSYGEDIYNPSGVLIGAELMAHELRHCARQWQQVDAWWEKYLTDPEFRYDEELYAHAEEYAWQVVNLPLYKDRNARARLAHRTAARLIAPLYNYQPPRTLKQAMRDLESLV